MHYRLGRLSCLPKTCSFSCFLFPVPWFIISLFTISFGGPEEDMFFEGGTQ